jgi:HEPN domain-containing protein
MEYEEALVLREWFRIADMDLGVAQHLNDTFHPRPCEMVCYHCQQAAEKYLKAYLLNRGVEPPKIHDLVRLYELCLAHDPSFREITRSCSFLSQYGIQPRYPHDIQIDDNIARMCLQYANQITAFGPIAGLRESAEREA